ncbi:DUF397 domain-containing protein [Streptomyces sp. NPDC047081]|uniref:DUF397 domain-containing protein n=1 Tax=Streptomyces sp. NPDC047081 TaxID=3154706 RepID=UPI0033F8BA6A
MQTSRQPKGATWRKSSYSSSSGGDCVEVAARWRKSSYSGNTGGDCVEVAHLEPRVAVRDSKNPAHGILALSPEAFAVFVGYVKG